MRKFFLTCVFLTLLLVTAELPAQNRSQILEFRGGGLVGNNTSAQGIDGVTYGDSGWFVDNEQLAAGTRIDFVYRINLATNDADGDPDIGRFSGGTLRVLIPSLGINSESVEPYTMEVEENRDGTLDEIRVQPTDGTGTFFTTRWLTSVNPFNNANILGMLPSPIPQVGDTIGTSANGTFSITLKSGHTLITNLTELLTNPVFAQSLPRQTLRMTCGGQVGSNPNAVGIDGVTYGNSGWFLNGSPLPAGELIEFTYSVENTMNDQSADPDLGRFVGGNLLVSIPGQGVVDSASLDPYVLEMENDRGGTLDEIRIQPETTSNGMICTTRWLANQNPFADANTLGQQDGFPPIGDGIGTSATGNFTINLASGDSLSTSATELFENPFLIQDSLEPFNDEYFGPQLNLPFTASGVNLNADTETDEQQLDNTGSTVWYFFVAAQAGVVTIDTFGSNYDTQLHVYTGFSMGFPNLVPVANNDDAGGTLQSSVSFPVEAGECYDIRVGGFRSFGQTGSGDEGTFCLNGNFREFMPEFPFEVDLDASDAPGSETQFGFLSMTDPTIIGNAVNATVSPTVTNEGVTITATQTTSGTNGFRDRGEDPSDPPPFTEVIRDFIFADGANGSN